MIFSRVNKVAKLKLLSLIWQKLSTQNFLRNSSWNVPDTQVKWMKKTKAIAFVNRLLPFSQDYYLICQMDKFHYIIAQSCNIQWSVFLFCKYNRQFYLAPVCQIILQFQLCREKLVINANKVNQPCPFEFGLRNFALDQTLVIFSSFLKKNTSGGLIMYLGEFDFSRNVYVVKITST